MNEITKRKLNATEAIIDNLPKIIEAFVSFYGEEERKFIEDKFKNMLVIGYCNVDEMAHILRSECEDKSNELIDEFLENVSINGYDKNKLKELIFNNVDLEYVNLHRINDYIEYKEGVTSYKEDAVDFLINFYPQVTLDNIDDFIKQDLFHEIDELANAYTKLIEEYGKYKEKIEPYQNYIDKYKELERVLNVKYAKDFLNEIKDYFTEEEFIEINKKINGVDYLYLFSFINPKIENILGYTLDGTSLIDAFNEENEKILQDENAGDWRKDSIKKDRIKYFKNLGFDFGEDYENYINKNEIISSIPSQEYIENISKIKKELCKKMDNEYYSFYEEYIRNRKRIEEAQLLEKNDGYNINVYKNGGTFISQNIKFENGSYIINPILFLNIKASGEYLDQNLFHELNHVLELSLKNVENDSYSAICGWDMIKGKLNNYDIESDDYDESQKRNYELFNEIINEKIAQEIHEIAINLGINIFESKEKTNVKGGTSYEHMDFLVKDFYEIYKEDIILSRRNGNINLLLDKVGKENFEQLNELFHIFNDNFGGVSIYNLKKDLSDGVETERTIIYDDLKRKRDEILNNMKIYAQTTISK